MHLAFAYYVRSSSFSSYCVDLYRHSFNYPAVVSQ